MKRKSYIWIGVGAVGIALILLVFSGLLIWALTPEPSISGGAPTAVVTVIFAPSATPIGKPAWNTTATPSVNEQGLPVEVDGVSIGKYIQISGTGGDGLRLRTEPGVNSQVVSLAMDAEVYEVKDGPKTADGYIWWYLVSNYDANRRGWAASKYITLIQTQPTP